MSSELHTRLTTSAPATNSTVAAAAIRTEPQAIQPAPAVTPETVAHPNPAANSAGVLAEHLSESNVSTHLSSLLKRQVSFKLRITPNKELALIDVAMIFNGLDNDQAGLAVRRLLEQFPDVRSNRSNFKFPGRGRQTVDVAPLAEALEFAFLLPGRNAAKVRKEAAKLLVRYLGGDLSLVDEIFLRNHVQAALAQIPEEERTAEQQTARLFGESVESTQPAPSIFHLPPPPIVMESCPTGCLDGGPRRPSRRIMVSASCSNATSRFRGRSLFAREAANTVDPMLQRTWHGSWLSSFRTGFYGRRRVKATRRKLTSVATRWTLWRPQMQWMQRKSAQQTQATQGCPNRTRGSPSPLCWATQPSTRGHSMDSSLSGEPATATSTAPACALLSRSF